jgi:hypothetical protein
MVRRLLIPALTSLGVVLCAAPAHAEIGSFCLRPLGIPDKWIENQTPPWDPTDTFDPTGPNPDVYSEGNVGFNPVEDQGRPMSLVVYDRVSPPQGQSGWPIAVGAGGFYEEIVACSGYLHMVGESFPSPNGAVFAPFGPAMDDLIAQDRNARWDSTANGGRGGVIGSAFPQSPRIIALPVFAPNTYGASTTMSPSMVKIVGFFVSERTTTSEGDRIDGYLTGWSQVTAPDVTAQFDDWAQLSATFTGPGSAIVGLPIDFLYDDTVVATAETDGTGTARPPTTSFKITARPGHYPGVIRVRIRESASFFVADEAVADLTVLKRLPIITWLPPADITYGTPLGPQQLNAVADVAGEFSYTPGAGTVLPVTAPEGVPLTATFVPAEAESELYDQTTATTYIIVVPAPLTVTVNNTSKLYLDPLPPFAFTAAGFVNGEGPSVLVGTATYVTSATASSEVGTYAVTLESIGAENYSITLKPGVLTIVPRPTSTALQSSVPGPSTYGQPVSFTVAVSSGAGVPGGTVTLLSAGLPVATAPLVNGQASVSVSSLDAGNHALTAQYAGNGSFAASSSASVANSVNAASTTTGITSSLNPSRTGQAVTFTATVTAIAPGAGLPAGSVEFLGGGVVIGTVPLTSGSAQLTVNTLSAGKHAIQARFAGTGNYLASVSAVLQQTVKGGGK